MGCEVSYWIFRGNKKYRLVCFDGRPVINGVELERMDYAELEDKDYEVKINDGLVGLFWKIWLLKMIYKQYMNGEK